MRALRLELARIRRCSSLARTADRATRPSRWPRAGCTVAAVCLAWTDRRLARRGAVRLERRTAGRAGSAALLDSSGHVAGYHVSAHTQYVVLVRSFSDGGGPPLPGARSSRSL